MNNLKEFQKGKTALNKTSNNKVIAGTSSPGAPLYIQETLNTNVSKKKLVSQLAKENHGEFVRGGTPLTKNKVNPIKGFNSSNQSKNLLILKLFLIFVIVIFSFPSVISLGSIQTGTLSPSSVSLCGTNPQYITFTASNIQNKENTTLTGVLATLYLSGNAGLNFITTQSVSLGSIDPLSNPAFNPTWTVQCNSPKQGIYSAYVNYTASNGYAASSINEATSVVTVHEAAPLIGNISLIEKTPTEQIIKDLPVLADDTPTIKVSTSRNAICKGTLDADETYANMDFIFFGIQKNHNYTFPLPVTEGEHAVFVKCQDDFGVTMTNSLKIGFIVDTAPPSINVVSPGKIVVGDFTELKVSANEAGQCRYDEDNNNFLDMEEFDTIIDNSFSVQLTDLEEEEQYEYYIKCKDSVGNIVSKMISFDVTLAPTAKITLEKSPPLNKGTYELTLASSKKLRSVPELSYTFTDDPSFLRKVNLVKEGGLYKGYIIIEDSLATRSGEFIFSGFDLNGHKGTEITHGKIFLVDSTKPVAPQTLVGNAFENKIEIKWYYEGETPLNYNIYRSLKQGVNYIDFYKSTKSTLYEDDNIAANQLYYYRVASVDRAGNVGQLSNEISVYAQSGNSEQVTVNKNPPTQQTRDWKDETEREIDSLLIDLDFAENNLKDQATRESAVSDLALIKKVQDAKTEITKLQTQLNGINVLTISDSDLRTTLTNSDELTARIIKTSPQSLRIEKSTNVIEAKDDSDIELAIDEYFASLDVNYTEKQVNKYKESMIRINKNYKVEVDIKTLEIQFLDASLDSRVLVEKKVSYESPEPLVSAVTIEIVPKTVAGDISSIDIKTPNYVVVKEDPIFYWGYDQLTFDQVSQKYVLLSSDDSESAKDTKSIVLTDPRGIITQEQNLITGLSIFVRSKLAVSSLKSLLGLVLGFIILTGLASYYYIVANDVDIKAYFAKLGKKDKLTNSDANNDEILTNQNLETASADNSVQEQVVEPIGEKIIDNSNQLSQLDQVQESNFESISKNPNFDYLQQDDPIDTIPEQYFHVKNGDVIRSITEMIDVLKDMDDYTFFYHVNDTCNDFADWADTIYHNKKLSQLIRSALTKKELIDILKKIV